MKPGSLQPQPATAPVSVVIVNWNSGRQLQDCVQSVLDHARALVQQIIIVDNGSGDRSQQAVAGLPLVELIEAGANLGFARACNLGAAQARAELLLFLNPDARLRYGSLQAAVAALKARPEVGICGVQLQDDAGRVARSCARFPSPSMMLAHAVGLDRVMARCGYAMRDWEHDRTREVDHVIGAFLLVRHALFDALGGFDERFFMYLEDLDFSLRARAAGYRCLYWADAHALHAGGGTSRQVPARRLFYALRSRVLYAFKHFGSGPALLVLLATLCVEPLVRSAHALLLRRGAWRALHETWHGHALLLRWLPRWIRGEPA